MVLMPLIKIGLNNAAVWLERIVLELRSPIREVNDNMAVYEYCVGTVTIRRKNEGIFHFL